jgi:hypothetical protein
MRGNVKIIGWSIIIIIVTIAVTIIFTAINLLNFNKHKPELNPQLLEAYDYKYNYSELVNIQSLTSDRLEYKPWVQFGNYDHKNDYSIVIDSKRQSTGSICKGKKLKFWFFGGSTMYGWGVPWWDSIPSNFVKNMEKIGKCVEAINYGVPYFFSKQEIIFLFNELLNTKEKPDFVILLDGLNDFGQPGSSIGGVPFFTPSLKLAIPKGRTINNDNPIDIETFFQKVKLSFLSIFKIEDSGVNPSRINYSVPKNLKEKSAAYIGDLIASEFMKNHTHLTSLCAAQKINCLQFLQPIAVKDYNPTIKSDTITEFVRTDSKFNYQRDIMVFGYKALSKGIKGQNFGISSNRHTLIDISNIFEKYDGLPYIDSGHYSPRANSKVSQEIANVIIKEWL